MKLKELLRFRKQMRLMEKFVSILSFSINLDMIELAKGKTLRVISSKKWIEALEEKVSFLVPKFTYQEWLLILSIEGGYQKLSDDKTEDVRRNLFFFLEEHYIGLYEAFQMKYYQTFQNRPKEEVYQIMMAQNAYYNQEEVDAILIRYSNGDRMCYNPRNGKRLVVENIDLRDHTSLIILVDKSESGWRSIFTQLKMLLEEE